VDGELLGASPLSGGEWRFVVYAPYCERLELCIGADRSRVVGLERGARGYFSGSVAGLSDGDRYCYRLDGERELPDPASRHQPDGIDGLSALFDPGAYRYRHEHFCPLPLGRSVIYELHVGTFTERGTLEAAAEVLPYLVELGVSAVEPLPLSQFPGARNWGYDGVFPYAVQNTYGGPRALQGFVDACHSHGLAVVLDVVYNHLGPLGNVLGAYGPYFTDRYTTPWGAAINVDGPGSDEVRRYFIENALRFFSEFRVDGLRLDAIHGIVDNTASPFLAELTAATRDLEERLSRPLTLIAESADNDPLVTTSGSPGGLGFSGQWSDDFHHALHALLTGERAGYYGDFGDLGSLAKAVERGFVFDGQYSGFRDRRHGAPLSVMHPERLVVFAQNHDQIGNRARGDRLSAALDPEHLGLVAATLLLSPQVPLLFMGEEYGELAPFCYFVDHRDEGLLAAVREGRRGEFAAFLDANDGGEELPDPGALATFVDSRPDRGLRFVGWHGELFRLYRTLIALRRAEPIVSDPQASVEVEVVARDGLVVLARQARDSARTKLLVFLHFGDRPLDLCLPVASGGWECLVDSAAFSLASIEPVPGARHEQGSAHSAQTRLSLPPGGFCAYRSPRGRGERERGHKPEHGARPGHLRGDERIQGPDEER